MGFRQVSVVEVFEVLRAWLAGLGLRKVAERAGVDRRTARRYVAAAEAAGLTREAGVEAAQTIMIGDTTYDMEMARTAGVGALGVAWGYHPVEALVAAGAHDISVAAETLVGQAERLLAAQAGAEKEVER